MIWNRKGATEGEYLDRFIYQDLQERCAEEASTSGTDRSGSVIDSLMTNEQLAMERRNLQEVEQLIKSVDKVLKYFLLSTFTARSYIIVIVYGVPSNPGLSNTVFA